MKKSHFLLFSLVFFSACSPEYTGHISSTSPDGRNIIDVTGEMQAANDPDVFWQHVSVRSASAAKPVVPGNIAVYSCYSKPTITWQSNTEARLEINMSDVGQSFKVPPEPKSLNGMSIVFTVKTAKPVEQGSLQRQSIFKTVVLPKGWRYPTVEELSDDFRKDSPTKYTTLEADFNGDGDIDLALLLKKISGSAEGLLVNLSNKKSGYSWLVLDETDWGKDYPKVNLSMGIELAKTGNYKTACAKGYWECKKDEPSKVEIKQSAIDYFKNESANSFFIWDEKHIRFSRIWMSY